jgi:ATP-dependent DNA ligase
MRITQRTNRHPPCQVGTGLSDQNLKEFHDTLKGHVCDAAKSYYRMGASKPDVWFEPKQVRKASDRLPVDFKT